MCSAYLVEGEKCEHIRLGHDGQVYLEHSGHGEERDPYTEVWNLPGLEVPPNGDAVDDSRVSSSMKKKK